MPLRFLVFSYKSYLGLSRIAKYYLLSVFCIFQILDTRLGSIHAAFFLWFHGSARLHFFTAAAAAAAEAKSLPAAYVSCSRSCKELQPSGPNFIAKNILWHPFYIIMVLLECFFVSLVFMPLSVLLLMGAYFKSCS